LLASVRRCHGFAEDCDADIQTDEDPKKPHPTKSIDNIKSTGWERKEVL